jgi:hypothetical protein
VHSTTPSMHAELRKAPLDAPSTSIATSARPTALRDPAR